MLGLGLGLRPMTTALRKFGGMEKGISIMQARRKLIPHWSGKSLPSVHFTPLLPPSPLPPFPPLFPHEIDPLNLAKGVGSVVSSTTGSGWVFGAFWAKTLFS